MRDGLKYIENLILKMNVHPAANAHAIPEFRAYESVKFINAHSKKELTEEEAKSLLKKEYYYQEHPEEYPWFRW